MTLEKESRIERMYIRIVLNAIDDGGGQTVDSTGVVEHLLKMSDDARRWLAIKLLQGDFDRVAWEDVRLF